jgi:hypothetical protein
MNKKVALTNPSVLGIGLATHVAIVDNTPRPWWKFWRKRPRVLLMAELKNMPALGIGDTATLEDFTWDIPPEL